MSAQLATCGPVITPTPSRAGSSGLWPPTPAREAAAHHRDVGQPQEQARSRPGCRRGRRRSSGSIASPARAQPRSRWPAQVAAMSSPRSGWRGTMISSGSRRERRRRAPRDQRLLAGMGAGGDDDRPRRRAAPSGAASSPASYGSGSPTRFRFSRPATAPPRPSAAAPSPRPGRGSARSCRAWRRAAAGRARQRRGALLGHPRRDQRQPHAARRARPGSGWATARSRRRAPTSGRQWRRNRRDRAGRVDGRILVDARRRAGGGPASRPRRGCRW